MGIKRVNDLPKVRLWVYTQSSDGRVGPEETSVYGALGCFKERSSRGLFEKDMANLSVEGLAKKEEKIFKETSGRGHGAVLDQNFFIFEIEDLPRAATLFLCGPQYLSHLQQSLRRSDADRGFFLPDLVVSTDKDTEDLLNRAFELYGEMKDNGIPAEDARYVLPLSTRTNIQTGGNARELMHLHDMSNREGVPLIVRDTVNMMIERVKEVAPMLMKKRETNYEVLAWCPSSQLFGMKNGSLDELIDKQGHGKVFLLDYSRVALPHDSVRKAVRERNEAELANLKHFHYTFLTPMSLSCFHQATRQRTWDQSVESVYSAVERGEIIAPPKILNSRYSDEFKKFSLSMIEKYHFLTEKKVPKSEAIGVIPHALQVYDLVHVNGWNAIHSIGKRTCTQAQWEIRGIAEKMSGLISEVNPVLGEYSKPQGVIYGNCPEKNPCGKCFEK